MSSGVLGASRNRYEELRRGEKRDADVCAAGNLLHDASLQSLLLVSSHYRVDVLQRPWNCILFDNTERALIGAPCAGVLR